MGGFDRITFDPDVMGGRACIRGMRVTVSLLVNLVANGMTEAEILKAYPYLESEDIRQALRYVACLAEEQGRGWRLPRGIGIGRGAAGHQSASSGTFDIRKPKLA